MRSVVYSSVDKVLKGKYPDNEIVVDHPACDGDVFRDIPIGSRVKITVIVKRKYNVITKHHGIREDWPKIFYIAETPLNILKKDFGLRVNLGTESNILG
jgi:hypothetical protein